MLCDYPGGRIQHPTVAHRTQCPRSIAFPVSDLGPIEARPLAYRRRSCQVGPVRQASITMFASPVTLSGACLSSMMAALRTSLQATCSIRRGITRFDGEVTRDLTVGTVRNQRGRLLRAHGLRLPAAGSKTAP